MTDYKQLCAELVAWAEKTSAHYYSEPRVLIRARAALAEPEPEGVTDEELDELFTEIDQSGEPQSWRAYARAVLARWGSPAPQPIPVTERLPGPEDCIVNPRNGQGQWCWGWCVDDSAVPFSGRWRMMRRQWLADDAVAWLPAHALPVPS